MNREIKFRAKKLNTNNWVYGYYAMCSEESPVLETNEWYCEHYILIDKGINGFEEVLIDIKTLGQFTGLIDKNGEQIYEGDILSYIQTIKNYDDDDILNPRHYKTPQYEDKKFTTTVKYKINGFIINDDTMWNKATKIGNIFDNPELVYNAIS